MVLISKCLMLVDCPRVVLWYLAMTLPSPRTAVPGQKPHPPEQLLPLLELLLVAEKAEVSQLNELQLNLVLLKALRDVWCLSEVLGRPGERRQTWHNSQDLRKYIYFFILDLR